ncbi:MAG: hypothetical protein ACKPKO_21150, partial [Candidatus Fonsibacter sp.]
APRHRGSGTPQQSPPLVGTIGLIAAAAKAIPQTSGMELVSCSTDELSQQCMSVSTDDSDIFDWMLFHI